MIADFTCAVIAASSTALDIWLDVVGAGAVVGAIAVCGGLVLSLVAGGGFMLLLLPVVWGAR
jgi:hypothetical protein